MATQDEIDKVERPAIKQLTQLGWTHVPGVSLAPIMPSVGTQVGERAFYRDVVLVNRLEAALKRLNPWLSDENLRKVMREFTHPNYAGLMEHNHAIWRMMVNYLSVEQDLGKGRKGQTVKIIDFENPLNNEFLCVDQLKIEGVNQNIIPDIVCFVNGLPLAVIECKSPYVADAIVQGIDQLQRYANLRRPEDEEGAQKLFWYNQIMVSTCRDLAKVGTISSSTSHYSDWKDAYPLTDAEILARRLTMSSITTHGHTPLSDVPTPAYLAQAMQQAGLNVPNPEITAQERLLTGVFNPASFLDLIRNFVVYEAVDGRLIKKTRPLSAVPCGQ